MYAVYAAAMRPLLDLPAIVAPPPVAFNDSEPQLPLENVRVASQHLAHQPWAASAKYHLRTQHAFVYTNDWLPEGKEGRVRLQPFAMAWVDVDRATGAERVITMVSESALVKFAGAYQVANPDPGRVVSAALQGRSQVAGPDGLKIDGHNFYFSESSAALWSDHPVRFAYAGNEGSAEKMQIDLIPQDGVPERDRPHIFGVRTVRLSKRVKMELLLKQDQEPLQLMVESENFDYEVTQRRAVYAKDVRAYRKTSPTEFDWIECDRMTVDFAPSAEPKAVSRSDGSPVRSGYQHLDRRLQFRRLHAEKSAELDRQQKPMLTSMAHKLRAWADTLTYDGEQRTVTLKASDGVKIEQQANQLKSPEVALALGDAGRLAGAWCRGAGWLVHRSEDSSEILFAADWRQELRYQPDPETGLDLWELGDSATFRQPGQSTALGADHIRVWTTPPKSDGDESLERQLSGATPSGVQARRMAASGNVVLISPRIEAKCQQLEGWIDPAEQATDEGVRTASATSDSGKPTNPDEANELPYQASADKIHVRMAARDDRTAPELAEIWTEGRVALRQPQRDGPARTMSGGGVHLQNRGGKDQVVHITGKPAQLRDQGYALEAQDMHIDRAENRVWINGPGALQLPIKNDLDGQPLRDPHPLDVTWKERMTFDGTLATFTGNAVARLGDRQMTCRQLKVTLSDRISFAERDRNAPATQVASVYCRDDVTFRNLTYEQNTIIEIQEARVWELLVDRTTGSLQAQGPGSMQMWCRGQGSRAGLAPPQTAKANRPVEIEPAEWEFTHVKFDGQMTGNLERRYSEFYDRVEILHGPVRQSKDTIHRDALPKGGGWMRCDVLRVMQQRAPELQRNFVQVEGEGNADLEGRGYYANADQVVYDQSRGTYMLRAYGKRKAKFWREGAPGEPLNPNQFQRGEVNRDTGVLRIDGAVSGEGGR
jgi:hypothetical protein